MKQIIAKAGERTKILHIVSDSIPQPVRFTAQRLETFEPPEGTVEIARRHWFARQAPERHPLRAEQTFRKGFADVDYAIYVTPVDDVAIDIQTRHLERKALFWILGGVIVVGILSAVLAPILLS